MGGPEPGNYLQVQNWTPKQYMSGNTVLSSQLVTSGAQSQIQQLWQAGYQAVESALDANHELYNGAQFGGSAPAIHSNSVWYTALLAMGVSNPSQYEGPGNAPGDSVDLRLPSLARGGTA